MGRKLIKINQANKIKSIINFMFYVFMFLYNGYLLLYKIESLINC